MTIYTSSVRLHRETLANAPSSAVSLARALGDAIGKAHTATDPNLNDQGITDLREKMSAQFREAGRVDLDKLRTNVQNARDYLVSAARGELQPPSDPAGLIRMEQRWRNVERVLTAGGELRDAISSADQDTLIAIAEFGPAYLKAANYSPPTIDSALQQGGSTVDGWIDRAIYRRAAEVATDTAARDLFQGAADADAQYATAAPYLEAASSFVEHGSADMLGAAVASQVAANDAA